MQALTLQQLHALSREQALLANSIAATIDALRTQFTEVSGDLIATRAEIARREREAADARLNAPMVP